MWNEKLAPSPPPMQGLRLDAVWARIRTAEQAAGRPPGAVALVAVSKTFPAETVAAAARAGQHAFGENYAQEAVAKIARLRTMPGIGPFGPLQWHFIGPIQSNKTRLIAEYFDWVQSIDRVRIAQRLAAQRPVGLPPLQILIEVNLSGEASKGGVPPAEVVAFGQEIARLPGLRLRGLMAIPAPGLPADAQRVAFGRLRALQESLRDALRSGSDAAAAIAIDTLSMGMSADFETAIAEGATMVRIGTAIFGERT